LLAAQPAPVPELRETLLTQFATHLLAARRFQEIVEVLRSPLARAGGLTASLHFIHGLACTELRQHAEAAEQFRQCLAKRNQRALCPAHKDIRTAAPHHCLALCWERLKKPEAADKALRAALAEEPNNRAIRRDYARLLAENGQAVEGLKLLHALVSEQACDSATWQIGAKISLGHPDYFEFAADWTGEAVKHLPGDPGLRSHRLDALLLNQQFGSALQFLRENPLPADPLSRAKTVLCQVLNDLPVRPLPAASEPGAAQEFLKWYRHLLDLGASGLLNEIHNRVEALSQALPSAGKVLQSVLLEAARA
jgi:tetratricopeptide (TPR) repeat protein